MGFMPQEQKQQPVDPAEHPSYDAKTDQFVMGRGDDPPDFAAPGGTDQPTVGAAKPSLEKGATRRRRQPQAA